MEEIIKIDDLQPQEVNEDSGFFMIVYGKAGVTKTTVSSKIGKKVLLLDCEGTASLVEGLFRIPVTSYTEIVKYKNDFLKSDKFDTLVLDGLRSFEIMLEEHVCNVMGRAEYSAQNAKYGDIYNKKRILMTKFIETMIGRGKKIIFISHVAESEKVDDDDDSSYIFYEPNLKDKELKNIVPAMADIVSYLHINRKEGTSNIVMSVLPSKSKVCKNRFDITDLIIDTDPVKISEKLLSKISEFYKK